MELIVRLNFSVSQDSSVVALMFVKYGSGYFEDVPSLVGHI